MMAQRHRTGLVAGLLILGVCILVLVAYIAGWLPGINSRGGASELAGAAIRGDSSLISYQILCPTAGFQGSFLSRGELGSENEVVLQRMTDANGREINRLIPGQLIYHTLVLYRPLGTHQDAWNWREMVMAGNFEQARGNCDLMISEGLAKPHAIWTLVDAWPSDYSAGSLFTEEGDLNAYESITIVYEALMRK